MQVRTCVLARRQNIMTQLTSCNFYLFYILIITQRKHGVLTKKRHDVENTITYVRPSC